MKELLLAALIFVVGYTTVITLNVPEDGEFENNARQTFKMINQERQAQGRAPLIWDAELETLALKHSQFMADSENLTHSSYNLVENVAKGTGNPQTLFELWQSSPSHYSNMIYPYIKYGAVAIALKRTDINISDWTITIGFSHRYATFLAR